MFGIDVMRGRAPRVPYAVGAAVKQNGTAGLTVAWPTHEVGDYAILFIQSSNQAIATPTGFTQIFNSTGLGTAVTAGATRYAAFYRRATSNAMGSITVADSGDHTLTSIQVFRNVHPTLPLVGVSARGSTMNGSFVITVAGVANGGGVNSLVFLTSASARDTLSDNDTVTSWTNNNLRDITIRADFGTNNGTGGTISYATGRWPFNTASNGGTGQYSSSQVVEHYSFALRSAG